MFCFLIYLTDRTSFKLEGTSSAAREIMKEALVRDLQFYSQHCKVITNHTPRSNTPRCDLG